MTGPANGFRDIVAGILGGLAFLFFLLGLKVHFLPALGIGAAAYIGTIMLFPAVKPLPDLEIHDAGITPEMVKEAIGEGEEMIEQLRSCTQRTKNPEVKAKVEAICHVAEQIIGQLEKDPSGIKVARKFLSYYLEASGRILQHYVELSSQEIASPEMTATLAKAEQLLDTIRHTFESQLIKLLESDVFDLDTELTVLEQTIKMEGL